MKPSRPLLIRVAFALMCILPLSGARGIDPVPLEKIPAEVAALENELTRTLEPLRAALEQEIAAKRVNEAVGQSLRWTLRTTRSLAGLDLRNILGTAHIPEENAALTQAFRQMETAHAALLARREELYKASYQEGRTRVATVLRTATSLEEIEKLAAALEAARGALGRRQLAENPNLPSQFSHLVSVLGELKDLAEAEAADDLEAMRHALATLRSLGQNYREAVAESDIRARIDRVTEPLAAAAAESRKRLENAIDQSKPLAEVTAALAKFQRDAERLENMPRQTSGSPTEGNRGVVTAYGAVVGALTALRDGDAAAVTQRLQEARSHSRDLGVERAAALEPLFTKWQNEAKAVMAERWQQRREQTRARLVAVKDPAQLEALGLEVTAAAREPRDGDPGRDGSNLGPQLLALATAWSTDTPTILQNFSRGDSGNPTVYAKELRDLRERIERDILSRILKAPELLQPPLAAQPLETAIQAVCASLAERGEWRRLHDLLQARQGGDMGHGMRGGPEPLAALRSFFAGQNFELAEQWAEAAQAYKSVLLSVSQLAPTKPAAERLKALAREHPAAANPAAPSPRGGPF